MLVKMLSTMASADGVAQAGQVIDLPRDQADALIAGGFAVPEKDVAMETATLKPDDNAAKLKKSK